MKHNNATKAQIYMRNIVWNIDFCKKLKQLSFWKRRACQKLKHSQFSTVPCLPKAYRNQANTSSLGIALWNICGISKSDLLRAFEALGAFRSPFGGAFLEAFGVHWWALLGRVLLGCLAADGGPPKLMPENHTHTHIYIW